MRLSMPNAQVRRLSLSTWVSLRPRPPVPSRRVFTNEVGFRPAASLFRNNSTPIIILFGGNYTIVMSMATSDSEHMNEELQQVFEETEDPVQTAPEVASRLGVTQQAADRRHSRANDRGHVERKKTGSRSVVWWPTGSV